MTDRDLFGDLPHVPNAKEVLTPLLHTENGYLNHQEAHRDLHNNFCSEYRGPLLGGTVPTKKEV